MTVRGEGTPPSRPLPAIQLRSATRKDAKALAAIYNYYVTSTTISFEETPVPIADMAERVAEVKRLSLPFLVAMLAGKVAGFAYANRWKGRCAYRYSVETAVYVDKDSRGQRIGSSLYQELLPLLERSGIHAVMGGIAMPNAASVALHETQGFKQVALFREVGFKFGGWIDVGYWEKVF